jgi:hypothetical protein
MKPLPSLPICLMVSVAFFLDCFDRSRDDEAEKPVGALTWLEAD